MGAPDAVGTEKDHRFLFAALGGVGDDEAASAALAWALQALWQDGARAQRLGERNLARIRHDGRRETQMDAMAAWYKRLLVEAGREGRKGLQGRRATRRGGR